MNPPAIPRAAGLPVWDEVKVMVSVGGMRLKHGGQLADIFNGTARILIERRS